MNKNIIFDFDGTLVDSLDLALAFGNENQKRFAKNKISKEEFRQRSMREVRHHIGLPLHKVPQFVLELKEHLKRHLHEVPFFPEIPAFISELKNQGFRLYVLSSNSHENIESALSRANLLSNFENIVSDSSIFGKHRVLEKLLKTKDLTRSDTVYIGDEVRDAEACEKCGIPMIAVAWGWDSPERLLKVPRLSIAHNIGELRNLISAALTPRKS